MTNVIIIMTGDWWRVAPQICIKYQMPYLLFTPNHIM